LPAVLGKIINAELGPLMWSQWAHNTWYRHS